MEPIVCLLKMNLRIMIQVIRLALLGIVQNLLKLFPRVGNKAVIAGIFLICSMLLAGDYSPLFDVKLRKPGVTLTAVFDIGHVEPVGPGQGKFIDATAADNHDLIFSSGKIQGLLQRIRHQHTLGMKIRRAGQYDIAPARQRPADGFIGFTPHNNGLAHGHLFEMREIGR